MISHEEAQALVSARLDGPLDPADNRSLLGHLATCASCRRFAEQTNVLARGLRDLPQLAPSPVVSRAVLERISQGRSPWTRIWEGLKLAPAPLVAGAAVIILLVVGANILLRGGDDDSGGNVAQQLEAVTETAQATDDTAADGTEPSAAENAAEPTEADEQGEPTTQPTTETSLNAELEASTVTPIPPTSRPERIPASGPESEQPSATLGDDDDQSTEASGTTDAGTGPESGPTDESRNQTGATGSDPAGATEETTSPEPTPTDAVSAEPTEASGDDDQVVAAAFGPDDSSPESASPTQVVVIGATRPTATPLPTETTTPEPTATTDPTVTPEATATATPVATETLVPTQTAEPTQTATPEPQSTATERPRPTATPEPTETPESTATGTAEPTNTPDPTETPVPTATQTPEPTETPEPTATNTPDPTETPEPTNTPEPTETLEPTEIPEPTATATEEPTETPEPTVTPEPTATEPPAPTETPTPDGPPLIVPREGSDVVDDGSEQPIDDADGPDDGTEPVDAVESTPEPETTETTDDDQSPTPAAIGSGGPDPDSAPEGEDANDAEPTPDGDGAGEPRIEPIGDVTDDDADGKDESDTGNDAATGPADDDTGAADSAEATDAGDENDTGDTGDETETLAVAFDLATAPEVIAAIPGPTTPDGALRYAGGDIVVGADGGNLSVVTGDGGVIGLGPGFYPVWSDDGSQLLYTVDDGASPAVYVYSLGGGSTAVSAPGPDGAAFRDVPAGWSGGIPVILRTDRSRQEYAELYTAGSDAPFWRREGIGVVALTPIPVDGGFLIATTEGWLLVDLGGGEQNLGPVTSGEVGAGVVGPGGLLAFFAGGGVWVGSTANPAGAVPIAAGSGFDFAPSGDAIVVSDGVRLTVYDLGGTVLAAWTPGDGSGVGSPYWTGDGITVPVGSAVRLVPAAEILE